MSNLVFLLVLVTTSLLCLPSTHAAPATTSLDLARRQNGSPVTVVTVDTIQGSSGPITETCNVTLTPITVNGQAAFREEKSCTQSPGSSNNNNSPSATTSQSPDSQSTSTSSDDTAQQSTAGTDLSASSTNAAASATQSSTVSGTLTSTPVAPTDVSVIGASTANPSAISTGLGTSGNAEVTPSASSVSAAVAAPTDFTVLGASSMDAASVSANAALASSSLTAGAPNTTGTTAAFAIPGKQIQVLPIGLGVFAGVSVIALIVVGLVTYERTKYRKKFRQEKLAESAAPMGYGGMAEVR